MRCCSSSPSRRFPPFLVWRAIPIGKQLAIVNRSGVPAPRIGGIAVAIAFWFGIGLSFALPIIRFPIEVERIALMTLAGAAIVLFMLLDDAVGLAPRSKLLIQIGVAALMVVPRLRSQFHGIAIEQFNAPILGQIRLTLPLALVVTIVWFVAMMNAINWIDGIDGLAPTVTLVASVILFLHTWFWPRHDPQFTISVLPLVLGAALIGFLPFNWFPARITLGRCWFQLPRPHDRGNFHRRRREAGNGVARARPSAPRPDLGDDSAGGPRPADSHRRQVASASSPACARGGEWEESSVSSAGVSLFFGVLSLLLPSKEAKFAAMIALGRDPALTVGRPGVRSAR